MAGNEVKMKVGLDVAGVTEGLKRATKSITDFSTGSLGKLGKVGSFLKSGLVMGAIKGIKNAIADMTEMKRAADRLGVSSEMFQKLSYAAEQSGVSTDRMADAMKDLDVKLQDGIMRGGSFAELMGELGLDMQKLADMPADQRMLAFADAIQGASGSLSRFGADEFGDAMFEMLPLLEKGSAGIMELGNQATIVSDKHLKMAEDAQQFIDGTLKNMTAQFSIFVAEGIKFFQGFVAGVTQAVIEVGDVFGNLGDIIMAALKLDWDGVKRGFDNMSKDATGAWDRIGDAYGDYANSVEDKQDSLADGQKTITDEELKRTKANQDAVKDAEKIALKMIDNVAKANKKKAKDEEKAEKDRIKHVEKLEKLNEQAAKIREQRDMAALSAQEQLMAIQKKIADLRIEIAKIDDSTKEGQILKAKKILELEGLITEEGEAQVNVQTENEEARAAQIEQEMKQLELERAIAEAMGDTQKVAALDQQIQRQSMINELVDQYGVGEQKAQQIVDGILRRQDERKQKELQILKARAEGNDLLADQMQNQIDKQDEINDLMTQFGIGVKEATALYEKLAKVKFGPDLNQSGFVTEREQKEFDRQQKVAQRAQQKMIEQELRDERQVGGALLGKQIPPDISRAQRARERDEDRIRREENRQLQRIQRGGTTGDLGMRAGGDFEKAQAIVNQRRAARQQTEQQFKEAEQRAAQIQDPWERAAELRRINRQEKAIDKMRKQGMDEKAIKQKMAEEGFDPDAKFDMDGNLIPEGDPRLDPKDPKQPDKNPVVAAINDLGTKLDTIDTSINTMSKKLDC